MGFLRFLAAKKPKIPVLMNNPNDKFSQGADNNSEKKSDIIAVSNSKAGYIAITGKPNAGKSTLMNAMLEAKLSAVTRKAQTTRKRVLGILSNVNSQMVFLDNPGILEPKYELQRKMMEYVFSSIEEADLLAVIIDAMAYKCEDDYFPESFFETIKELKIPKIGVLNKIDLEDNRRNLLPKIKALSDLDIFDEIIPISALKKQSVPELITIFEKYLPQSPFFYDPEIISDMPERFFVSEIIREHIFNEYHEEIPYSTEVIIEEFKERERNKWYIRAEIVVDRDSQKGIIIGAKGKMIKLLGEKARKDIESHLQRQVFLDLFVKVKEKWRDNPSTLNSFGY